MVCIFDPACELLPPWTKELCGNCVLLPLYCTFSLTSSPLPPSQCTVSDVLKNLEVGKVGKVSKVGKVGEVGKVGREGLFMPTWNQL